MSEATTTTSEVPPPFAHQVKEVEEYGLARYHALFWEQGSAKSRATIMAVCKQYHAGIIDTFIVITDNGAHDNWALDELPLWLDKTIPYKIALYHSKKAKTKRQKALIDEVDTFIGLRILCISYDAVAITDAGKRVLWRFLRSGKCFVCADEGSSIKSSNSERSTVMVKSGQYATSRWLLNGTPVDASPFDVFAQVRFVDPTFWERELGISTLGAFKAYFAEFETNRLMSRWDPKDRALLENPDVDAGIKSAVEGKLRSQGLMFDTIKGYRNLDQLQALLKKIGTRVLKEDVLDLPEKVYAWAYFHMSSEQERMYSQLKEECFTGIGDEIPCKHCEGTGEDPFATDEACFVCKGGGVEYTDSVTAILPIVRMLRFQQLLSGYVASDDGNPSMDIKGPNPRLETLEKTLTTYKGPHIVFSRFSRDIDKINGLCKDLKLSVGSYDGRTGPDERIKIRQAFQNGELDVFNGNTAACAKAITLNRAQSVVYYTNSFRGLHRHQSEDRAHRGIMDHSVTYIDICCPGTIDHEIIKNLRKKLDLARQVTGDRLRQWLAKEEA